VGEGQSTETGCEG